MDTSTAVPLNAALASSAQRDGFDMPSLAAREIERLRERVRELSAELIEAQESVRRHLAHELHDGVGAELTATRFALAGIETWLPADAPPQCAAALAVANRSLDAVHTASREAIAQLHAPSIETGLAGALKRWVRDFSTRTGLRTTVSCSDDARLARLPADAALAVFRVAQEALNNVAKHARATCADVRIETGTRHLRLCVSDDGVGLPRGARERSGQKEPGGHFGLAGMQARCAAFDGTLRVSAIRAIRAKRANVDRGEDGVRGSDGAIAPRGTVIQAHFAWHALFAPIPAPRAARRALQS